MGNHPEGKGRIEGLAGVMTNQRPYLAGSAFHRDLGDLWKRRDTIQPKAQATLVDETVFRNFYDRTVSALRSYLRMLCRDTAVADDLLQESYFRFLQAGISGLNELQMKAYLYKTATSAARDHWRAEKRERRWQEVPPAESESAGDPNLSHDMNQLFQKLNPSEQTLLWLAYVEGFQHREIAEALNLKEKSVRVMLFRARKQLAEMVTQEGLGPKEKA